MKKMFGGGWRIVGLALSVFLDFLTGDGRGAKVHKKNMVGVPKFNQKKIPKGAKVHKKKIPEVQNDHIATVDS